MMRRVTDFYKPETTNQRETRLLIEQFQLQGRRINNSIMELRSTEVIAEATTIFEKELQFIKNNVDVVTDVDQVITPPKRVKKARPENWRDIAWHFIIYGKTFSTIKKYDLLEFNPSIEYWYSMLNRWKKDYLSNKVIGLAKAPCYGNIIDLELAAIVERYFENGVPMTDAILRMALLELLRKHNRNDILAKVAGAIIYFNFCFVFILIRCYSLMQVQMKQFQLKRRTDLEESGHFVSILGMNSNLVELQPK